MSVTATIKASIFSHIINITRVSLFGVLGFQDHVHRMLRPSKRRNSVPTKVCIPTASVLWKQTRGVVVSARTHVGDRKCLELKQFQRQLLREHHVGEHKSTLGHEAQ
jgi:hypothetical protein